jgi:predicted amidohydrolase
MSVRIVEIQIGAGNSKPENVQKAESMLESLGRLQHPPHFVCLPEMFSYLPALEDDFQTLEFIAEDWDGPTAKMISGWAKRLGAYIVGGSAIQRRGGKHYNTSLVFGPDGAIVGDYSKTHLFDTPDFQESRFVEPGKKTLVIETEHGRIGVIICYDIRFPELLRTLILKGAEIIFCPAAFPIASPSPGQDHWQILTRAAALQNMVYVVAVNQFEYRHPFHYFGRSVVVDPWGIEIATAPNRECVFTAEVDRDYLREMRRIRSPLTHRRPELYEL